MLINDHKHYIEAHGKALNNHHLNLVDHDSRITSILQDIIKPLGTRVSTLENSLKETQSELTKTKNDLSDQIKKS